MSNIGMVHVYCGLGKGKTTAAIGLGIRAAGNGLKVCMIQFLKTSFTGELKTLKKLEPFFNVHRLESPKGFFYELTEQQKETLKLEVLEEFEFAKKLIEECDVLILDEILGVLENKLLQLEQMVELIKSKPDKLELILTGRNVPEEIMKLANYVSEIKSIKHPGEFAIEARKGIEF